MKIDGFLGAVLEPGDDGYETAKAYLERGY